MRKLTPVLLLSFVNVIGFSLLIPVLPEVLELLIGESSGWLYGLLLSAYAFSQFVGSPVMGSLSDRYGRRPILILSQAGTLLSWVIFASAFFIPRDLAWMGLNVPLLVIAFSRITDGLTGGNISVAQAWVSDRTSAKERTKAFGVIGATFGLGFLIGPVLGGFSVASSYHFLGTALVAMLISVVTLAFVYWGLPESLPPSKRDKEVESSFMEHFKIFKTFALFRKNAVIKDLILVRTFFSLAFVGFTTSIILLFGRTYALGPIEIGLIMSVIGMFSVFNQGVLIPRIARKLGDYQTFFLGLLMSSLTLTAHALLPWMMEPVFAGMVLVTFFVLSFFLNLGLSMTMTTFKTIITTNTPPTMQGKAMGLDESIGSFGQAVTPLFAGFLYDSIDFWSFAVYGFALLVISMRALWDCSRRQAT